MRDIGDEFLLVVLGGGHSPCHIAQRGRKITHFVVAFYIQLIVHIAGGVLFCRGNDLSEGTVDDFRKEDQDDDGQKQNNDEHQVGDVQHVVGIFIDLGSSGVNDHITPCLVIVDDGGDHTEFLLVEGVKKSASRVIILLRDGGIEPLHEDFLLGIRRVGGIDDHSAGRVDDPDLRVHEVGEGLHLFLNRLERNLGVVQIRGIGVRDPGGFPVHVPGSLSLAVLVGQSGDKSSHCHKSEESKQSIGQYELQINCFSHIMPVSASVTILPVDWSQTCSRYPRSWRSSSPHDRGSSRGSS